jgi:hypothetical protein
LTVFLRCFLDEVMGRFLDCVSCGATLYGGRSGLGASLFKFTALFLILFYFLLFHHCKYLQHPSCKPVLIVLVSVLPLRFLAKRFNPSLFFLFNHPLSDFRRELHVAIPAIFSRTIAGILKNENQY